MRHLARNGLILLAFLAFALYSILPPEEKIRLGKDLRGGASLLYGVDIKPGEEGVMSQVIEVVKERLDPKGVMEISIVAQGTDRIEITMPLPSEKVKKLRAAVEGELQKLDSGSVSREEFERAVAMSWDARAAEFVRLARSDQARLDALNRAASEYDAMMTARAGLREAQLAYTQLRKEIEKLKAEGMKDDDAQMVSLVQARDNAKTVLDEKVELAAPLEIAYESARDSALAVGLTMGEVRRALGLSDEPIRLRGKDKKLVELPSERRTALDALRAAHPDQTATLDAVVAAWNTYEANRTTLDDPSDLVRMLRRAGVLNFRITVQPGEWSSESEARAQLKAGGPRAIKFDEARWYKINKLKNWIESAEELEIIKATPDVFFQQRGYVVEEFQGEYFMLCWDRRGLRLTEEDGEWRVTAAYQDADQIGRPAIAFRMDPVGGNKLGELTGKNLQKQMAVLLDDEVYTAPTLLGKITTQGQISGNFSQEELAYIIRVLGAGSLQAKLTPDPISQTTLAPTLGADNLRLGLRAGVLSFFLVAGFMVVYYFGCGLISIIALLLNALLLLAAMALNHAAFTLPGIAGVILTFGMAVDANVLIYERMREEMSHGNDLRTAVRLGYQKALSAIVDGNVTTLIVCVVLGFTGTQEIKGFAITLGIGTVTTLFAQLFGTRFLFTILVEKVKIRRLSMLSMMFPGIQRALSPSIDWLRLRGITIPLSLALTAMGVIFIAVEGRNLLGTEFRGGTAVTINFRTDGQGGPIVKQRPDVENTIHALAEEAGPNSQLFELRNSEVVAVNPQADNVTSGQFVIKTLLTDTAAVQAAVSRAFENELDAPPELRFRGAGTDVDGGAPVYAISSNVLGESIDRPEVRLSVPEFYGGAAVVLEGIDPPTPKIDIENRIRQLRIKPENADISSRQFEILVIEGTDDAVRTCAVLVSDPKISYFDSPELWKSELRDREWDVVSQAAEAGSLASVQSFSPSVAASFRADAIVAVLLSTLLIVIYVWVRFNSFRYSMATIVTTAHDCLVAIGLVALAGLIYRRFPEFASSVGLMPFKIDLNVVAAILTILGYSLNDTIVVMDRVRENRGKLPYASKEVINAAVNQTISRTIITGGTTFGSCIILYVLGGEGLRVFAYTMIVGIIVGTYSSIAVAAPLIWSRKQGPPTDGEGTATGRGASAGTLAAV